MQFVSRWNYLVVLVAFVAIGCTNKAHERTVITLWHFWSEPHQRYQLEHLIKAYEKQHPDVDILLTELSWTDGKAKLQLAFNAGTVPDIIHIGQDWFPEFDAAGVFQPLHLTHTDTRRSTPWLVNVRAFVSNGVTQPRTIGIATSDPHNVLKRCLPLLWLSPGVNFGKRLPLHIDLDESFVAALVNLTTATTARLVYDRSRQLDEALLNKKLDAVLTGAWIIDMARARNIPLRISPTESILNGDVLCLTRQSKNVVAASLVITYLTKYEQARQFALSVHDAGFPADLDRASRDSAFTSDSLLHGFLRTAKLSRPLPTSPLMLQLEPIVEGMLDRAFRATNAEEIRAIVTQTREELRTLERSGLQ